MSILAVRGGALVAARRPVAAVVGDVGIDVCSGTSAVIAAPVSASVAVSSCAAVSVTSVVAGRSVEIAGWARVHVTRWGVGAGWESVS